MVPIVYFHTSTSFRRSFKKSSSPRDVTSFCKKDKNLYHMYLQKNGFNIVFPYLQIDLFFSFCNHYFSDSYDFFDRHCNQQLKRHLLFWQVIWKPIFYEWRVPANVITTKNTLSYAINCCYCSCRLRLLPLVSLLWHLQLTTFCLSTLAWLLAS